MKTTVQLEKTYLGIELGSTRIKAVLIDDTYTTIASSSYEWENKYEDGYWTYSMEDIHSGISGCFEKLSDNVFQQYHIKLTTVGAMGISAMMHGYMAFDSDDNLLVPFRTWRNTTTEAASKKLTELFEFNIPQRWSIAHLYQAILNDEPHVKNISYITTLAGYIHFMLTGRYEVGIDDGSGIFPINGCDYDFNMIKKFNNDIADKKYNWKTEDILPSIRLAGDEGAFLTKEGAKFLDPKGNLKSGIPICPPEGDAGTGMVATNSVLPKTGNISGGTSIFSMLVLEKPLKGIYQEIDIVSTPDGSPVAMVHCNNCTSELNAWVKMFGDFAKKIGVDIDTSKLFETIFNYSIKGENDCGGVIALNYLSGEHITGIKQGSPMYFRTPNSNMTLENFLKSQLYSCMATLKIGMDILFEKEHVKAEQFQAHGGLFKVKDVAQQILANALNTPVAVCKTANEGGAWGIALLSSYMVNKNNKNLGDWLTDEVFKNGEQMIKSPQMFGVQGFNEYLKNYMIGLNAERALEEVR